VVVPSGHFRWARRDEKDRDENGPYHPVSIARPFAVGRYPVTFAEWDAFVAAGGTTHRPDDKGWGVTASLST
jgi:formylglycine-generating enzyme required for sulfatase activity